MPQHLTYEGVKSACRRLYAEGHLLFQNPAAYSCRYEVGEYRCAIGAALSLETLALVRQNDFGGTLLYTLVDKNIVVVENREDARLLANLQRVHDSLVGHSVGGERESFLKLIGVS